MLYIEMPIFNSLIAVWNNSREIQTNNKFLTKIVTAIVNSSHKYFQGTVLSKDVIVLPMFDNVIIIFLLS